MCSVCVSFSDFEGGSDSVYIGLCSGGLRISLLPVLIKSRFVTGNALWWGLLWTW